MSGERLAQRAGDDSTQFQVNGDLVVNQGVSAEAAAAIAAHIGRAAAESYTAEALDKASGKIEELVHKAVTRFTETNNLGSFADPAFQKLLHKAQISAAASDGEGDIDMLVGLLEARVSNRDSRPLRASISRAVEIVDEVDGQALDALTATYALFTWSPTAGVLAVGLRAMEDILFLFLDSVLPDGSDWLEHLEALGAVRISHFGTRRSFLDIKTTEGLLGYVARGVPQGEVDDQNWATLVPNSPLVPLIPHELRPGHLRLPYASLASFKSALRESVEGSLNEQYLSAAKDLTGFGDVDQEARDQLTRELAKHPHLARFIQWWDSASLVFTLTGVGRVLAISNLKRRDKTQLLPNLEFN